VTRDHVTRQSFLVCTTPRSGSGVLCDTLWRIGSFGRPDEYFCDNGYHPEYATGDDRRDFPGYINKVRELATGGNGVLGVKIMWDHFVHLIGLYRSEHSAQASSDLSIACTIFSNPGFIWLSRQNKLHQAVSLYRRRATGVFYRRGNAAEDSACPEPAIDELEVLIKKLEDQDSQWANFFRLNDSEPLKIHYEELRDDISGVVMRIADFLDIDLPHDSQPPKSDYKSMSDTVTESWIAAYERARGPYTCE